MNIPKDWNFGSLRKIRLIRLKFSMLSKKDIGKVRKNVIQEDAEDRIPFMFQALADTTRLKIFRLLAKQDDLCVTDIAKIFNLSTPAISYQMRMLEMVGIVKKERMGKMICYELKKEDPLVKKMMRIVK